MGGLFVGWGPNLSMRCSNHTNILMYYHQSNPPLLVRRFRLTLTIINRIRSSSSEDPSELAWHAILLLGCHHDCLLHGYHHWLHPLLHVWLLCHHLHLMMWYHLLRHALLAPLMLHWLHLLHRLLRRQFHHRICRPGLLRPLYEWRNNQADAPSLAWKDRPLGILWVASHGVMADCGCHIVGMA